MTLRKNISTIIDLCLNEGKNNGLDIQILDIETLLKEVKNKKYVDFMYVTEFPDITVINIPHYFTLTNKYKIIETYMLQDKLIKYLNIYFKKYGLKIFVNQNRDERIYNIVAQPINYNLNIL